MNFQEWQEQAPDSIRNDALWKMSVYRYALFIGELGWFDVTKLQQDRRTYGLSSQLYEALGSVSANIAEGYSRGSSKDRAHFYEYSLGSARESRDWFYKGRHILGNEVAEHRMKLLVHIIRLLLTMTPQQRGKSLHEEQADYLVNEDIAIETFLMNVPMP